MVYFTKSNYLVVGWILHQRNWVQNSEIKSSYKLFIEFFTDDNNYYFVWTGYQADLFTKAKKLFVYVGAICNLATEFNGLVSTKGQQKY